MNELMTRLFIEQPLALPGSLKNIGLDHPKMMMKGNKIGQSGEGSLWRVCYQRGLPILASFF